MLSQKDIEFYMGIAHQIKSNSKCLRTKIGAIIVKDNSIISTGYNGVSGGVKPCIECERNKINVHDGSRMDLCIGCHAEWIAIINCANQGISLEGGVLFTTMRPCMYCTKMILASGIKEVYYDLSYGDDKMACKLQNESSTVLFKSYM